MNETSLYESLYGHPASKPEPAEHALFQKVEAEFYGDIESLGAGVVRQFTMLLNKPDLKEYQQYAFYLFNERAVDWPNIDPKTKAALILGRGVMQEGLWTPNYENGLEVPDDPDIDCKWLRNGRRSASSTVQCLSVFNLKCPKGKGILR